MIGAVLLIAGPAAMAQTPVPYLNIDFGNTGQQVEPGWVEFSADGSGNNDIVFTYNALGDTVTVAVTNVETDFDTAIGNIDFRDRGNITPEAPLTRVIEDHLKNNNGVVTVVLSGLSAGEYSAISYHNDLTNSQADIIDLLLTDANGPDQFVTIDDQGSANNQTDDPSQLDVISFTFRANGTDDVLLFFDSQTDTSGSQDDEIPLSGLAISKALIVTEATVIAAVSDVAPGDPNVTLTVAVPASCTSGGSAALVIGSDAPASGTVVGSSSIAQGDTAATLEVEIGAPGVATLSVTDGAGCPTGAASSASITVHSISTLATSVGSNDLPEGGSTQISATGTFGAAGDRNVTNAADTSYASDSDAVATVDGNGQITAVSAGTANITITNGGLSDTQVITVHAVSAVSLALASSMATGQTQQASLTGDFGPAGSVDLTGADGTTYASDDESVVTVGVDGLITAVGLGIANVTGTSGGVSTSAAILVQASLVAVGGLSEIGGILHFHATDFDARPAQNDGDMFVIIPDEETGNPNYLATASDRCDLTGASRYMQIQNGSGGNSNPPFETANNASLQYEFSVTTTGTYRIWLRLAAASGSDDSLFLRIREISPGQWWRVNPESNNSEFAWQDDGGFGTGTGGGVGDGGNTTGNIEYTIDTPGTYHLDIQQREDGLGISEIILDSTGAFDGTDGDADTIACSPRTVTVNQVQYVSNDTVNIRANELPTQVSVGVLVPSASDGFVTLDSSDDAVAADSTIQFATFTNATAGGGLIDVTGVGSTSVSLSNDMGFANSPDTLDINVIALQDVDLRLAFGAMEPGENQQTTVIGGFGAAGSDNLTTAASGTTYASDNTAVATVDADGAISAVGLGAANITATNAGVSSTQALVVADPITKIAFMVAGDPLLLSDGDLAAKELLDSLRFTNNRVDAGGQPAQVVSIDSASFFTPGEISERFDLVVASDSIAPGDVGPKFLCENIAMVYMSQGLNDNRFEGLTSDNGNTAGRTDVDGNPFEAFVDIQPRNTTHPIMQGLPVKPDGFLDIFTEPQVIAHGSGQIAPGAVALADNGFGDPPGADNELTIVVAEANGIRIDDSSLFLARRVFLGIDADAFPALNDTGKEIVSRSVDWTLAGERLVIEDPVQLTAVPEHIGFRQGSTLQRQARLVGAVGACREVEVTFDPATTFETDNPSVAAIDDAGIVTAGGEQGTAVITIRNPRLNAEVTIDVTVIGPTLRLVEAFHFGTGRGEDDAEPWTCPVFNDPSRDYIHVLHQDDGGDGQELAVALLSYEENLGRGWGYIQHSHGQQYSDISRAGALRQNFGAFDQSENDRDRFFNNPCPERLYGTFIGAVDFAQACGDPARGATGPRLVRSPPDLGGPCGADPVTGAITGAMFDADGNYIGGAEGIAFRVDVPVGDYVFVGAWGDEDNVHSHTIFIENGGVGDPGNIQPDPSVPPDGFYALLDLDQAQATAGQTEPDELGEGVVGALSFDGLIPPPADGTPPDPKFVFQKGDSRVLTVTQAADLPEGFGYVRMHQLQGASNDGVGGERDPNGGDAIILELWRVVEEECGPGDAPTLVSVQDNLGSAPDTFISPLGDNVPFDSFAMNATSPVAMTGQEVVYTGDPANAPSVTSIADEGAGRHTVTLDRPIEPGQWAKITLEVTSLSTGCPGTLVMWLAHQPLDINQSGGTNIGDATAFGVEFNGEARPALLDINGDGSGNVRDATAFGNNWNGVGGATQRWSNTSLPARPQ